MACTTMTTYWACGKFDAESCDSVETVAQRRIEGQNYLAIVFSQNMTSLLQKRRFVPPYQPNEFVKSSMLSHMTVLKP